MNKLDIEAAKKQCEAYIPHEQHINNCRSCHMPWPCDVAYLSAALEELEEAQGKLDAVAALRWRIYVIESYIANGGHRGWMYNSSPFLIPYILDRILEGE